MAVDPMLQQLLSGFQDETREICERVTARLLAIEQSRNDPAAARPHLIEIARGLHTIKGSAATLGLDDVSGLAHRMEDALAPVTRDARPFTAAMVDAVLHALDVVLATVTAHAAGAEAPGERVERAAEGLARAAALLPSPEAAATEPSGEVLQAPPTLPEAPEVPDGLAAESEWRVQPSHVLSLARGTERLRDLRGRLDERRQLAASALAAVEAKEGSPALAAELLRELLHRLRIDGDELSDSVGSFEENLKEIYTRPIKTVLEPLSRTVRDLSRQLAKEARLSYVGGELGVDRRILVALKAPLMHLVRNAVDHGIEAPEERERAGKHREGALVIRAEQIGNLLTIEISDDGRGLDTRRIAEVAQARGLIAPEEAAKLPAAEIHRLIFRSGFSTRAEVTSTSGRGVGLDVVHAQIQALSGDVDIQTRTGQGTRFFLTVPLELGASVSLVVTCAEHALALPMASIERLIRVRPGAARLTRDRIELADGDEILPLVDLGAELRLGAASMPEVGRPVAILQVDGERLAVAVDAVVGDRELVIRPLPLELRHLDAFQGTATTADGTQILIVRPAWIAGRRGATGTAGARRGRILVVDDSLTARAIHRTILEAGGFAVHTVGSAQQALETVGRATYDALVCDVAMAGMDGIALTQTLRRTPQLSQIPVILVSAQADAADRQRGTDAGADAFVSKTDCARGLLLEEVNRLFQKRASV